MQSIQASWESIPVEGKSMPLYVASPKSEPKALVIVLQEIFGVNSHIRDVTERFAREGYLAAAPDVYHRSGDRFECGYSDFGPGRARREKTRETDFLSDIDFVIKWAKVDRGVESVGAVGFCYGGRLAFLTACAKELRAVACFYGGAILESISLSRYISCPIRLFYGEKDKHIPVADVRKIEETLLEQGKEVQAMIYPADHGFFCDQRASFDRPSAEDAWKRTLALFGERL